MAIVRITEAEAEGGPLPPYCIHCGEPTVTRRRFRQNQPHHFTTKFASLPVCERHNTAWPWPEWVFLLCIVVPILAFIVSAMFLTRPGMHEFGMFVIISSVATFLFAGLVKLVYRAMQPIVVRLPKNQWQLSNIHDNFANDLEDCRDDADEFRRERRRTRHTPQGESTNGND